MFTYSINMHFDFLNRLNSVESIQHLLLKATISRSAEVAVAPLKYASKENTVSIFINFTLVTYIQIYNI